MIKLFRKLPIKLQNFIKIKLYDLGYVKDDIFLIFKSLRGVVEKGTMLDVGGNVGNSALPFCLEGWEVTIFEPDPRNIIELKKKFSQMDNVKIVEKAVSDKNNEKVEFFLSDITSINSLSSFDASHNKHIEVETITLDKYLQKEGVVEKIDFLKIDIEGYDLHALRGFNIEKFRPKMILVEYLGYNYENLRSYIEKKGYKTITFEYEPIVKYGKKHTLKRIFYGKNMTNPLGWGNILAIKNDETEIDNKVYCTLEKRFKTYLKKE